MRSIGMTLAMMSCFVFAGSAAKAGLGHSHGGGTHKKYPPAPSTKFRQTKVPSASKHKHLKALKSVGRHARGGRAGGDGGGGECE